MEGQFVGVDRFGLVANRSPHEIMDGSLLDVENPLLPNPSAALNGPGDPLLIVALVLPFGFPADHGRVKLHDADQRGACEGIVAHHLLDAVAEVPRRSCIGLRASA